MEDNVHDDAAPLVKLLSVGTTLPVGLAHQPLSVTGNGSSSASVPPASQSSTDITGLQRESSRKSIAPEDWDTSLPEPDDNSPVVSGGASASEVQCSSVADEDGLLQHKARPLKGSRQHSTRRQLYLNIEAGPTGLALDGEGEGLLQHRGVRSASLLGSLVPLGGESPLALLPVGREGAHAAAQAASAAAARVGRWLGLRAGEGDEGRGLLGGTPAAAADGGRGADAGRHGAAAPQESGAQDNLESLDYEVVDNAVFRNEQARRGKADQLGYVAMKWLFALLLGIATGVCAFGINVAVEILAGWKFVATSWLLQRSYLLAFSLYAAVNLLLVLSSAAVVTRFAPAAAGSGIPEIKGYLNGIDMPGILLVRTLIGKMLGSVGSVAGGLALGKEGPLVHTGACLAALISQGGSTHYHVRSRWASLFQNDRDRRDMVTCGAAAGAAAAFRAPVGGVLFALEEVTSWWRPQLMWRVFFTSAIVAIVLRACMRWCEGGECGKFASGGFIIWDVHGGSGEYFSYELLPMAMLGLIGGLLGALFNQLTLYMSLWRRSNLHRRGARVKMLEACLVAAATSFLSFMVPFLATCRPCPDPVKYPNVVCPRPRYHWGNFVQFNCHAREYNDLATIFFNTPDDAIRNLFSSGTIEEFSAASLLTFLVIFFALAVVTYGIAVPAGQFVPGILLGATYGRLVGMLMVKMYGQDNTDEGTYALLGAASFLGGSMRMTVSLCVIMVEITNNLSLLPLIMLVLLISKAVGDGLNPGFYDLHAHLRGIPILEMTSKRFMHTLQAMDAASTKVVYFSHVEMVGRIVEVLKTTSHNGYPVLEDLATGDTALAGLILRSQLLVLLRSKADFQQHPNPAQPLRPRYSNADFSKPVSSKGMAIADIHLSHEDLTQWLDLRPFLNPTPYVVDENMSLTKVHALFRQLGLRHLCVVPRPPRAVGIITRKDLLPEVIEGRHAELEDMSWDDGLSETVSPMLIRRGAITQQHVLSSDNPPSSPETPMEGRLSRSNMN